MLNYTFQTLREQLQSSYDGLSVSQTIYLDFRGALVANFGNESFGVQNVTVGAAGYDLAAIDSILLELNGLFEGTGVDFAVSSGDGGESGPRIYVGSVAGFEGLYGISDTLGGQDVSTALVFSDRLTGPEQLLEVVAHEVGHFYGLGHDTDGDIADYAYTRDSWEPDNSFSSATNISNMGSGYVDLTIHTSGDADYILFRLNTTGTSANYLRIDIASGSGDLDLWLYSAGGSQITSSRGTSRTERISLSGLSAGYYYAKIAGYGAATGAYRFTCNVDAGGPTPDLYEANGGNNNGPSATVINASGNGLIDGLSITPSDYDYYRFTLTTTGGSSNYIGINLNHSQGDLDIALVDSNGNFVPGRSSATCSNYERISLSGIAAGTYYLKVYGYNGATGNYSLVYDFPTSSLAADAFESNNTLSSASDMTDSTGIGTVSSLTVTAGDLDYYRFRVTGRESSDHYVGINLTHSMGDLDIYLFNSRGDQVRYSVSCTNNERISLSGLAAGDYYLQVRGYNGATGRYSLLYNLPENGFAPDTYEGSSGNHSVTTATTAIQNGGTANATIHSATDGDLYKVILSRTGTSADYVSINFTHSVGDLDLHLYDRFGNLVKYSVSTSNSERISLAGLAAGTYYAGVFGYRGATNAYGITVAVASSALTADSYEGTGGNNSIATATDLRTLAGNGSVQDLSIHTVDDVDYFKFTLGQTGSSADFIRMDHQTAYGDLDLRLYGGTGGGTLLASSLGMQNQETISLAGRAAGTYYLKVHGYAGAVNNYSLTYNILGGASVTADSYEGREPVQIRQSQTFNDLTISANGTGSTRADTFRIELAATGTCTSKIVFSNYRADWNGLSWELRNSGGSVVASGNGSTVELNGRAAGAYTLTVDSPNHVDAYSNYKLTATLPEAAGSGGSGGSGGGSSSSGRNDWSVLVYVAGDNNLEAAAIADIVEMQRANLAAGVEVYVLLDRIPGYSSANGNWTDTRVGKITYNAGGEVVVNWTSWGELNTGSAATLTRFIDWGMQQGPAENYAVVLWDHGGGMTGGMSDENSGSALSLNAMRNAFNSVNSADKNRIRVVGFDACLMATAEVVDAFNGIADYVVGSEELEGGSGWNYTSFLSRVTGGMNSQQFADAIVAAGNSSSAISTLSAVRSNGTMTAALNAFAGASANFTSSDWSRLSSAFRNSRTYSNMFSDLIDIFNRVSGGSTVLTNAISTLRRALTDGDGRAISSNYSVTNGYGNGISTFNPLITSASAQNYFSNNVGLGSSAWGTFLRALANRSGTGTAPGQGNQGGTVVRTFNDFDVVTFFTSTDNRDGAAQPIQGRNLGVYSGRGLNIDNLLITAAQPDYYCFDLTYNSEAGDLITVIADDSSAALTLTLLTVDNQVVRSVTGVGAAILELDGINPAGGRQMYLLQLSSNSSATYNLAFEAGWATGVDYFDYAISRTNSAQDATLGNSTTSKATVLSCGSYSGLLTHSTDADYYQLDTQRAGTEKVTVYGDALVVEERDAAGATIRVADRVSGGYQLNINTDHYLYVRGTRSISGVAGDNICNYSINVGDRSGEVRTGAILSDFDGNGTSDLLMQNSAGQLAVWNSGRAAATTQVGNYANSMVYGIGNFNADSCADVLLYHNDGRVSLLNGKVTGLNTSAPVTVGNLGGLLNEGWQVEGIGDFDANGYSDILWRSNGGLVGTWDSGVAGIGDQLHTIGNLSGILNEGWRVIGMGDFDADGHSNVLWQSNAGLVGYWAWDNARGQLSDQLTMVGDLSGILDAGWRVVGIADFDGNGFDDVLWQSGDRMVGYWAGQADGMNDQLTYSGNLSALTADWRIEGVGDFGGDGKADILWRNYDDGCVLAWGNANDQQSVVFGNADPNNWRLSINLAG